MGRLNTRNERESTLDWAREFRSQCKALGKPCTLSDIRKTYDVELKKYFALACLSRSKTELNYIVEEANKYIFNIRIALENMISTSISNSLDDSINGIAPLFFGSFYGSSKKQGTSLRMPLTTCQPTNICRTACYAHDVLDATPLSVIRGTVNGLIGSIYEAGGKSVKTEIMKRIAIHTQRAVAAAKNELKNLQYGFKRRANIRFAHVGEVACFPKFSNNLAKQIYDLSSGEVDCVVYTRHRNAIHLDPDLFIVNFTLDSSSPERRAWIPEWARVTFSAFGGNTAEDVDINFLEHHRWMHYEPRGNGKVCPATLPSTIVRNCDACMCNFCFTHPNKRICGASMQ